MRFGQTLNLGPCSSVFPEAKQEASQRPLKGALLCKFKKALKGYERDRDEGIAVKDGGEWHFPGRGVFDWEVSYSKKVN